MRFLWHDLPNYFLNQSFIVRAIHKTQSEKGVLNGNSSLTMASRKKIGPIPPGRYFILSRKSGGRLGSLRDFYPDNIYGTDRETWFALYKDDLQIDDTVFVEGVKRGNFRLHPVGPAGLGEGCLTLSHQSDFDYLRQALLDTTMMQVPCSSFKAYGTVTVT